MSSLSRRSFLAQSLSLAGATALTKWATAAGPAGNVGDQVLAPPSSTEPRDFLYRPVSHAYQDISISTILFGNRRARIYYPSYQPPASFGPIWPGRYPIVVFCHGQRYEGEGLCPSGIQYDHRRWPRLLRLLARCGFIVIAPDMTDTFYASPYYGAPLVEEILHWVRTNWVHRAHLRTDAGKISDGGPGRSYLGLIAHSWSVMTVNALLARNIARPDCIAFTNATWHALEPLTQIYKSSAPMLSITGSADGVIGASYTDAAAVYGAHAAAPKFIAIIQGAAHWSYSDISFCQPSPFEGEPSPGHAAIASDLLTVFMYKYLYKRVWMAPNLQIGFGERPNLDAYYAPGSGVALAIAWMDPWTTSGLGHQGQWTRGEWASPVDW